MDNVLYYCNFVSIYTILSPIVSKLHFFKALNLMFESFLFVGDLQTLRVLFDIAYHAFNAMVCTKCESSWFCLICIYWAVHRTMSSFISIGRNISKDNIWLTWLTFNSFFVTIPIELTLYYYCLLDIAIRWLQIKHKVCKYIDNVICKF